MNLVWRILDCLYNLPWWVWPLAVVVFFYLVGVLFTDCCTPGFFDQPGPVYPHSS